MTSYIGIQENPLDIGSAPGGVGVKVDDISNCKQISTEELVELVASLNALEYVNDLYSCISIFLMLFLIIRLYLLAKGKRGQAY